MSQIDAHNIDEWIFNSLEGNLGAAEQQTLDVFLQQNPAFVADFEAWKATYVQEPVVSYPGAAGLQQPIGPMVSGFGNLGIGFLTGIATLIGAVAIFWLAQYKTDFPPGMHARGIQHLALPGPVEGPMKVSSAYSTEELDSMFPAPPPPPVPDNRPPPPPEEEMEWEEEFDEVMEEEAEEIDAPPPLPLESPTVPEPITEPQNDTLKTLETVATEEKKAADQDANDKQSKANKRKKKKSKPKKKLKAVPLKGDIF